TPVKFIAGDTQYTTTYDYKVGTYNPAETLATRGFVAVKAKEGVLLSWRNMGQKDEEYTVKKGNTVIYTGTLTNFLDKSGKANDEYTLLAGNSSRAETAIAAPNAYQEFTLSYPADCKMPNNSISKHTANDMSVGDLDGDGILEIVLKWDADNAQDNSKDGWTGTTILDAYKLDFNTGEAKLMWRIDLGLNIRSGAHYTQFQVWDYDGDGVAEVLCKTADGTTTYNGNLEETGHVGAVSMADLSTKKTKKEQEHDYRVVGTGRILSGPEYLTAFDGRTGEIIDTVDYVPSRGPENAKGQADMESWGDTYGNRVDRFLAATAYIDEGTPAAIFCRGYYARTTLSAWKLVDRKLQLAWAFDAPSNSLYAGQGDHGLSVNDVDRDGLDEIIYGSLCLDNDGSVLYCTALGHGDAMHVSDFNYDGRIDVFQVHENAGVEYQIELHDAETGEVFWGVKTGKDTGRGMAADIDPNYEGAEMWGAVNGDTFDCNGNVIYKGKKPSVNFSIFWDGDLLTELFDHNNYVPEVQKWDYEKQKSKALLSAKGTTTNNGTKANPCLIADIYGDWREEVILRCTDDPSKIRIYTTTYTTEYTAPCLLLNRAYREGIAWQNSAYNQPANLDVPLKDYVFK
ncbi:MAG: rhamnogalacturonan lyase, partial [Lachnospiraceae bacterium]|nr:rhamnogalacturonan lyase [Lachnospiraceae bacterium]